MSDELAKVQPTTELDGTYLQNVPAVTPPGQFSAFPLLP